jgi:hypothetical protein
MDDTRDVAIRPVDNLIASAVANNLDVDKLERLIDMRNKELARTAKLDYDEHFAAMQKEYVPVGKGREAKDRDGIRVLYKYCPLEDILRVYQPIISKHGFSYRWAEEAMTPTERRIWCIVAGYGHEERSYVDIPIPVATSFTNAVQQRGSATTYGKRYSFVSAFGVIIDGEDDDAGELNRPQAASRREPAKPSPGPASSSAPAGEVNYEAMLDAAIAAGKLDQKAASQWIERLSKEGTRKGAEEFIRSNYGNLPPMRKAEPVDDIDAAADDGFDSEAKRTAEAAADFGF